MSRAAVASLVALTQHVVSDCAAPLSQVFDVSNNSFTGPVPPFLYANNVPPWTQPTVYIQVGARTPSRPETTHPDPMNPDPLA